MPSLKEASGLPDYQPEFTHVLHLADGRTVGSSGAIPTAYSDETGIYKVVHVVPWHEFYEDDGKV